MSNDAMTREAPMTNDQALSARSSSLSRVTTGEGCGTGDCPRPGRGEGPACQSQACGRWNLGFSLVVGSWSLALNLRIRTAAAATRVS